MASRPSFRLLSRQLRPRPRASALAAPASILSRALSSKHPPGFSPPSSSDLDELRLSVQDFCRRELSASVAASVDSSNAFPADLWAKLGAAGLLGITVGEAHGGVALGYQAHCVVMEELSRASASVALSYAAHSQLCVNQLQLHGTEAQKERWLVDLVSGEKVGALAMSEHGAGSDVVGMSMRARDVEGGWKLSGTKMWITNGPDAHTIIVYAKTDPAAGSKGITAFIVDTATKGFSVSKKLDKLGMRGSNTGELVFEDVFVPHECVLGGVNKGTKVLMEGLDLERLVLSAGPIGIMQAVLDLVLPYTHTRKQFGQPIANNQLVQAKLADIYTKFRASQAFTYAVARHVDENHHLLGTSFSSSSPSSPSDQPTATPTTTSSSSSSGYNPLVKTQDCAGAILYAAERATECALDGIQLMGGMGYMNEVPAGRLLRDAKLYEIGAGTSEVRRIVIGRAFNREFGD